jgi:hypothetical protein
MSVKSLSCLNKINDSMIWYSTIYYKYYRWLSSQYLYFLYFFNKLLNYLDLFFFNFFWVIFKLDDFIVKPKISKTLNLNQVRFSKPVSAYLVNINHTLVVYNMFYHTTLANLQALTSGDDEDLDIYNFEHTGQNITTKLFYY